MNTAITFHDLVSYSLGVALEDTPAHNKRNGVYFPQTSERVVNETEHVELVDATLFRPEEVVADDDDISTWEFHAPVASSPSLLSRWNSDASTCASPYQTPAQDIVYRYRAGLKVDLGECSSCPESSAAKSKSYGGSFFDDDSDSFDGSSLDSETCSTASSLSVPFPSQQQVKPAFRASRANALLDIREEALAVLKEDNLGEQDPVVCHRPDCRDTLSNMKALIYHLHIHNMHDRGHKCEMCGKRFESQRTLTMHNCPRLATSCPSSPIRDTFMRVLTKITSRE
ncbi:hypothetical protein B0H14DRAFT_3035213 [Mycena olivaceomarginata]|nr:hypothetical protein B0H14DRAFT_3035213 [Mycena olivaceomarginata]